MSGDHDEQVTGTGNGNGHRLFPFYIKKIPVNYVSGKNYGDYIKYQQV